MLSVLGATDSAVPCTMMINLAKVMAGQLEPFKNNRLSIMFIFFDGEEAFRQWGPNDSIYGARHLAKQWQGTEYKDGANELQRMVSGLTLFCIKKLLLLSEQPTDRQTKLQNA